MSALNIMFLTTTLSLLAGYLSGRYSEELHAFVDRILRPIYCRTGQCHGRIDADEQGVFFRCGTCGKITR